MKHSGGGVTSPAPTCPTPATVPAMPVLICGRMPVRRDLGHAYTGRGAAEFQDRHLIGAALGEGDLIHPAR